MLLQTLVSLLLTPPLPSNPISLKNSTLLVQLNDAFCKTHPWLAQKVCTKTAHAADSKVSADAVLKKALNEKKQGTFILLTYIIITIKITVLY